jgi:hypothetical protein
MAWEILNEERGVINSNPDKARLLGEVGIVVDTEASGSGSQLQKKNSGMPITVRRVRFGGVYAPGSRVKYTSAYDGTRVEQAGAEVACGIVDPFLSASTAAGDVGLIFTEGPMDVVSSAAFAVGDLLQGAATGKVATATDGVVEGRAIEAATGGAQNKRAYMSFPQFSEGSGTSVVQTKTADYTVLATESGNTFDTTAAGGAVTLALPAAVPGLHYFGRVGAVQELRFDPNGTETISLPSTGVAGVAGKYLTANAIGETVYLKCVLAGTWSVYGFTGTWTAEA